MINNKDTYTINEENKVIINDRTREEIKFILFYSHFDKSTTILLNNNLKCILIEADKTLFSHNDQTEFRYILRYTDDGSTLIQLDNDKHILIEADKTLFSHNGQTEFRFIFRFEDKSTLIRLDNKNYILIKADKTLFSHNGETEFRDIRRWSAKSGGIVLLNGKNILIKNGFFKKKFNFIFTILFAVITGIFIVGFFCAKVKVQQINFVNRDFCKDFLKMSDFDYIKFIIKKDYAFSWRNKLTGDDKTLLNTKYDTEKTRLLLTHLLSLTQKQINNKKIGIIIIGNNPANFLATDENDTHLLKKMSDGVKYEKNKMYFLDRIDYTYALLEGFPVKITSLFHNETTKNFSQEDYNKAKQRAKYFNIGFEKLKKNY